MFPFSALRTLHYRLLAVVWTIGVILAVTIPTGDLPGVKPGLGLDKIVHAALFAGFGVLWLRGVCPPTKNGLSSCFPWRGVLLFSAGILFAAGTEVYQHLASIARRGGPYDAAADLFGLLVAFGGYYVYHQLLSDRASARRRAGRSR